MDYTAVGQTTHLAARSRWPGPARSLSTADVLTLAEGAIAVRPLGPVPVKGLADRVEVFEVTGAGPARGRLQAMAARALNRFVGRHQEMEHLGRALELARGGHGQLAAVVGEPGVGKSRLVFEFTRSHRAQSWLVLESGAVSYGQATPYLPVIDLLRAYFKIGDHDGQRTVRERITGKLLALERALESAASPLLALFDLPVDDPEWSASDPRHRRQRTLDAVKRLLLAESRIQPLLLVFEDLHWIDAETRALLDVLVESLPTARMLLLVDYRPGYQHAWGGKTYYTQLRIDPLEATSTEDFLHALLGPDPALDPLRRLLIDRTEGNPFFLEESVRALVETRALAGAPGAYRLTHSSRPLQIPATVQAILAARIDRLAPEHKRVLQAAAVIGKNVALALLRPIVDCDDDALRSALAELQATEFLYETRLFPDVEYTFKHALTHEVAYGALLHDRRRALHTGIVAAIEQLHRDRLGEQVELLAHHAVRGEVWEKAVGYLREAGTKAAVRSANADALSYLAKGLEIVETLPEGTARDRQEMALLLTLGPALQASKGLGAPEAERVFSRARELSERVGETGPAFQALWGQWMVSAGLGRIASAHRIGNELLALASGTEDRALRLEAHHAMWATSFWLGDLRAAEHHIERGIGLYDPGAHRSLAFLYGGHDPGVCCRQFSIWTEWLRGRPERARASSDAAMALAEQLAHPSSMAQAMVWTCGRLHFERNAPETGGLARRLIGLAAEWDLPPWRVAGLVFEGWSRAQLGDVSAGIAEIQEGLIGAKAPGSLMPLEPLYLLVLAAACLAHDRIEEGIRATDDALAMIAVGGGRVWLGELLRLKGELLLMRGPAEPAPVDRLFREALATAREQRAHGWELRAATSLGRLLTRGGRRDEARQAVGEVYARFTEGLDTPDLADARALLAEP